MLIELTRGADWWEFQASPTSLDTDTVTLEWSSRQVFRGVGPRRPVRRSVRDGHGKNCPRRVGREPGGGHGGRDVADGRCLSVRRRVVAESPPPPQRDLHHGIESGR